MKRTVQTTLTGEVFKKKPLHDPRNPVNQTLYCRFVEALCALRDDSPRAEAVREAQVEWKAIKGDDELVKRRICAYEEAVVARQRVACQFFEPTGQQATAAGPLQTPSISSDHATGTCPSSTASAASAPQELEPPALVTCLPLEAARAVHCFLTAVGVEATKLLTPDVLNQTLFMTTLRDMAECWLRFSTAKDEHNDIGQKREWNRSILKQSVRQTDEVLQEISQHLQGIADIQFNATNLLSVACLQAAQKKSELLRNTIHFLPQLKRSAADSTRRLEVRNAQRHLLSSRGRVIDYGRTYVRLLCSPQDLSWPDAVDQLMEMQAAGQSSQPLPLVDVLRCATQIQCCNAVCVRELVAEVCGDAMQMPTEGSVRSICEQLLSFLPTLLVENCGRFILVNAHEFAFTSSTDTLADLLCLADEPPTAIVRQDGTQDEGVPPGGLEDVVHGPFMKPGRKAKHVQFPAIANEVISFLEQHGFSAQARRRNNTASSSGVTLAQVRTHLLQTVPGLQEMGISRHTVHRLMQAPRRTTLAAGYYKGIIQARVPHKSNNVRKDHDAAHFCAAQVALNMELVEHFPSECAAVSCDNMNKVHVGTLAVSRYHQLRRFFLRGDSPDYSDHDFPLPGYKITPAGYLRLQHKTRVSKRVARSRSLERQSCSRKIVRRTASEPPVRSVRSAVDDGERLIRDNKGRLHYQYPRSGSLLIINRAAKFSSANVVCHAHDLQNVIRDIQGEGKNAVFLVVDGGPDWSPKHATVLFAMGRLWRDSGLDALGACCYSPGHSAYNMVERAWASRSNDLSGITLPAALEGEKPPCEQSGLSEEEKIRKEAVVFDRALQQLCSIWNGKEYDGFPVVAKSPACMSAEEEAVEAEHASITSFFAAGVGVLRENAEMRTMREEFATLMHHCTRSTYAFCYRRCQQLSCKLCSKHTVQASSTLQLLEKAGGLLSPQPSDIYMGHFATFLEMEMLLSSLGKTTALPDQHLSPDIARCQQPGCRYVFSSAADQARHHRLVHRLSAPRTAPSSEQVHRCTFTTDGDVCGLVFPTRHQLGQHKKSAGHKMARGRPSKK